MGQSLVYIDNGPSEKGFYLGSYSQGENLLHEYETADTQGIAVV